MHNFYQRAKYIGGIPLEAHMPYHHLPTGIVFNDLTTSFPQNYTHRIFPRHHHHSVSSPGIPGILSLADNYMAGFNGGGGGPEDDVISQPTNLLSSGSPLDELPLRLPLWGVVILVIAYALVFVCGVIGNCSVLFVVVRSRRMKTLVNLFILNLAVADLLVLFFCLLPNLVSNIFVPWVLGWYLCKTVPYIQGVSVCASIYSLLAISVERCVSIQWPFKYVITKENAKLIILFIWLWSGVVALPWALVFQSGNFDDENPQLEFCVEVWPKDYENWGNYYFLVGNLFICYIFPLTVILISYLIIWFRVYHRQIPSDSNHTAMEIIHQKSKTAVFRMIVLITVVFAFSWLPLYLITCRIKFGNELEGFEHDLISVGYPMSQWLVCFNSAINAVIYSRNPRFRKAFTKLLNQGFWASWRKKQTRVKHKSPTVNILLKRFSTYRVETTMSNSNNNYDDDSSDTI